jgi:hypothetical protein
MPGHHPISGPPSLEVRRSRRSNQQDQSSQVLSAPADLDIAFAETVEAVDFDWPERSSVERVRVGIAEMLAGVLLLTGLVVLIQRTISLRGSSIACAKTMDIDFG